MSYAEQVYRDYVALGAFERFAGMIAMRGPGDNVVAADRNVDADAKTVHAKHGSEFDSRNTAPCCTSTLNGSDFCVS